jgi:hypothetical protein
MSVLPTTPAVSQGKQNASLRTRLNTTLSSPAPKGHFRRTLFHSCGIRNLTASARLLNWICFVDPSKALKGLIALPKARVRRFMALLSGGPVMITWVYIHGRLAVARPEALTSVWA